MGIFRIVRGWERKRQCGNGEVERLFDALHGQLSTRCNHFCPASARVELLTSSRVAPTSDQRTTESTRFRDLRHCTVRDEKYDSFPGVFRIDFREIRSFTVLNWKTEGSRGKRKMKRWRKTQDGRQT